MHSQTEKHLSYFFLLLLIIAGSYLRISGVSQWFFEGDSLWGKLAFIENKNLLTLIRESFVNKDHPPLYYILLWVCTQFTLDPFLLRLITSTAPAIATIPLFYILGFMAFKKKGAAFTMAALITFSYSHIVQSFEIRQYSLLIFFITLMLIFQFKVISEQKKTALFWYIIFSFLALMTHYSAAFAIAASGGTLLLFLYKNKHLSIFLQALAWHGLLLSTVLIHHYFIHSPERIAFLHDYALRYLSKNDYTVTERFFLATKYFFFRNDSKISVTLIVFIPFLFGLIHILIKKHLSLFFKQGTFLIFIAILFDLLGTYSIIPGRHSFFLFPYICLIMTASFIMWKKTITTSVFLIIFWTIFLTISLHNGLLEKASKFTGLYDIKVKTADNVALVNFLAAQAKEGDAIFYSRTSAIRYRLLIEHKNVFLPNKLHVVSGKFHRFHLNNLTQEISFLKNQENITNFRRIWFVDFIQSSHPQQNIKENMTHLCLKPDHYFSTETLVTFAIKAADIKNSCLPQKYK